jgi:hypothetical protein
VPDYTPSVAATAALASFADKLARIPAAVGGPFPTLQSSPASIAGQGYPTAAIFDTIIAGAAPAAPLLAPSAKNAAFAATAGFGYLCTGGSYAATMVSGATVAGQFCIIVNVSATAVTITPAGGETISGEATWPLTDAYESVLLWAHSGGWIVVGQW